MNAWEGSMKEGSLAPYIIYIPQGRVHQKLLQCIYGIPRFLFHIHIIEIRRQTEGTLLMNTVRCMLKLEKKIGRQTIFC